MFDFDPKKDYYNILWVTESATDEEIKKAFRKLAMQYHPDKWWDWEKFKEINEAFQVVWDAQKRQQYDSVRKWGFGWFDFGNFWGFGGWSSNFDVNDIFDMFGDVFWWWGWWRRGRSRGPVRWDDIVVNMWITIEEAYKWWKREFKYARHIHCDECWGKGISKDSQRTECSTCHGKGAVYSTQRTPFGVMQVQTVCPTCHGEWYMDSKPCSKCWGNWLSSKQEQIEIEIPTWIDTWEYIKFSGMWNYGRNWGEAGDLYVKFSIKSDDKFKRKWQDLLLDINISIFDAVLWWEIEVPHPDGKVKVKIPKWLQFGDLIKVWWKWFWRWWFLSKRWDFILQPKISVPKKLSKEEEKLWNSLKWLTD